MELNQLLSFLGVFLNCRRNFTIALDAIWPHLPLENKSPQIHLHIHIVPSLSSRTLTRHLLTWQICIHWSGKPAAMRYHFYSGAISLTAERGYLLKMLHEGET